MTRLSLTLLGVPVVALDGRPVHIRRTKALALLAYLAVSGQPHHREVLATLLWPEQPHHAARNNLRRVLFSLHRVLGDGWLASAGESLALRADADAVVDVHRFRAILAQQRPAAQAGRMPGVEDLDALEEAVALYHDDFLSGFALADCPEFESWQRLHAVNLRADLGVVLAGLVAAYARLGELLPAIEHAQRWLTLDAQDETALRALMQLYARAGNPAAACRQYEEFAHSQEDGDAPAMVSIEDATTRLYHAIKGGTWAAADDAFQLQSASQPAAAGSRPSSSPTGGSRRRPTAKESSPFVARDQALVELWRHLDAALGGAGRIIFVAGEAGAGKTTLTQEFARRAQHHHPHLIAALGACNAFVGAGDPFLPFVEILQILTGNPSPQHRALLEAPDGAQALRQIAPLAVQALLDQGPSLIDRFISRRAVEKQVARFGNGQPDLRGSLSTLPKSHGQGRTNGSRVHEEYAAVLRRLSAYRPLLLLLDDLQWSDASSVNLLYHLGRRISESPILVIGNYRPEEVRWQADKPHPLAALVEEMERRFGQIVLNLDRVAEAEGRRFVDALLDVEPNQLDETFRQTLFGHSRGHALFTVELVRQMEDQGQLVQDRSGRRVPGSPIEWTALPTKVEAVIARRLHLLPPALYRILATASVEGEQFTADVLAHILHLDHARLAEELSTLGEMQHRLVSAVGVDEIGPLRFSRYRFRHTLYQRFLYNELDATERRLLHERVGAALETLTQGEPEHLEPMAAALAQHFEQGGVAAKAIEYCMVAGRRAVHVSANKEAITHFARGLDLLRMLAAGPARAARELELLVELSVPVSEQEGYGHASLESIYAEALHLAPAAEDRRHAFRALHGMWRYQTLRARLSRAKELAGQLMELADEKVDHAQEIEALAATGIALFHLGDLAAAQDNLRRCTELYDPGRHAPNAYLFGHDPRVSAQGYLTHLLWLQGRADAAQKLAEKTICQAETLSHPFSLAYALSFAGTHLQQFLHRPAAVLRLAEQGADLASKHCFAMWKADADILGGWAITAEGGVAHGIDRIRIGIDTWQQSGGEVALPYHLGLLADAYRLAGEAGAGLSTVADALARCERTGERWWEPELWRLRGELLLLDETNHQEIQQSFRRAAEIASAMGAKMLELRATVSLCRLWHRNSGQAEVPHTLTPVYSQFTEGFQTQDLMEATELLIKN
jgi:DNA-binding SARP family transcriptional activator/predicted ATPase